MYQKKCKKCESSSLHTEIKSNNTGLYCDDCGAWQQWLSKDDLRAFNYNDMISKMRDTTPEENKIISEHIHSISKPTGFNVLDNKTMPDRLKEFVEFLDKEIDRKMTTMPLSNEDAISKSSYCVALERVKVSIYNILDGKDYNYVEE